MKQKEKILTTEIVEELGLDDMKVITSDILEGYTSIGNYAFIHCYSLTNITLPNSVTSIGNFAFQDCSSLISITIPNSVTSIGYYAFSDCSSLTSITIPNSVTNIEYHAFCYCFSLTSVIIPNSVTSIENSAFYGCSSITSITIPNSVTNIERHTFDRCNNLKNVVIGNKTYEQQTIVNDKCKAYKAFKVDLTCRDFQYEEGNTYEIEGEPELCKQGFHACLNLLDVFSHYSGEFGKDVVVHEVELEGVSDERNDNDSKVVAKKITIGKRIL